MRRLALFLAIAAVLVVSAFAAQILWGTGPQPAAANGDTVVWGN